MYLNIYLHTAKLEKMMTKNEKRNLTWKLKDMPSAGELANLVNSEVITRDEAREIMFGNADDDKAKIEALEKMVEFLQGLVENLSKNKTTTYIPYERTVYIDRTVRPYWDRYWSGTEKVLVNNGMTLTSTLNTKPAVFQANYSSTTNGMAGLVTTASTTDLKGHGDALSLSVNADKAIN